MEIADDLEKDFKLTQMKMKALRKKGHELNGYRRTQDCRARSKDSIRGGEGEGEGNSGERSQSERVLGMV